MTLGEKIAALRAEHKLSQGDLAEALCVSRQSVSKWETDTSVPELDKLIQISELFHVTLDELVKGDVPPPAKPQPTVQVVVERPIQTRKIIGVILLCFGAVAFLVLTLLGGIPAGLLFSSPFLLCGAICLTVRHSAGLWCAWAVLFCINVYLRYATGITWRLTRFTLNYHPSMNYMRLIFAWVELLCFAAMAGVTVFRLGRRPLAPGPKVSRRLAAACAALAASFLLPPLLGKLGTFSLFPRVSFLFTDWIRLALLTAILTAARRLRRGKTLPPSGC